MSSILYMFSKRSLSSSPFLLFGSVFVYRINNGRVFYDLTPWVEEPNFSSMYSTAMLYMSRSTVILSLHMKKSLLLESLISKNSSYTETYVSKINMI